MACLVRDRAGIYDVYCDPAPLGMAVVFIGGIQWRVFSALIVSSSDAGTESKAR